MAYRDVTDRQIVAAADRICRPMRGRVNPSDFEDLYQDVCLSLVAARDRFNPRRAKWSTFSDVVGQGAVKDFFRSNPIDGKQWRRTTGEVVRLNEYEYEKFQMAHFDGNEKMDIVDVVSQSSNARARFVALCLIAGYTRTEISSMLGVNGAIVTRAIVRFLNESSRSSNGLLMG